MAIRVTCSGCSKSFDAPDAAAGRRAKCPSCGAPIDIPDPSLVDDLLDAELDPIRGFDDDDFAVEPPAEITSEGPRKPCPMCGEMIALQAVKCRFCGEIFDPALKRASKKKGRGYSSDDDDLSTVDWVLAIICSGIGCIVGIVYLIQGKSKGGKMLGVSIVMMIIWNVISAIIQSAAP